MPGSREPQGPERARVAVHTLGPSGVVPHPGAPLHVDPAEPRGADGGDDPEGVDADEVTERLPRAHLRSGMGEPLDDEGVGGGVDFGPLQLATRVTQRRLGRVDPRLGDRLLRLAQDQVAVELAPRGEGGVGIEQGQVGARDVSQGALEPRLGLGFDDLGAPLRDLEAIVAVVQRYEPCSLVDDEPALEPFGDLGHVSRNARRECDFPRRARRCRGPRCWV